MDTDGNIWSLSLLTSPPRALLSATAGKQGGVLGLIILFVFLVICGAYFGCAESGFSSMNRIRIKSKADDGDRRAKNAAFISNNFDRALTTILIGNNIVNLTLATISTLLFSEIIKSSASLAATLSTIISTIMVLIFGEITPKTLAKESPEKVAMFVCPIVDFCTVILYPLNLIFTGWKALMKKVFKFSLFLC